jgi:hypothetical protein
MRLWPALLGSIFAAALPAAAVSLKLDIVPFGVKLLSASNPQRDTVEIKCYVYNGADTAWVNKGNKALPYLDIRVDDASVKKRSLAVGDSLPGVGGFFTLDTVAVAKSPFVVTTIADPSTSFGAEAAVEEYRASSRFYDMHPKVDTVVVPGCPPGTVPTAIAPGEGKPALRAAEGRLPTEIYDAAGHRVWRGRTAIGEIPAQGFPEGVYLLVRDGQPRSFRIAAPR